MKKLLIILSVYCGLAIGLWGATPSHETRDMADDHQQHSSQPSDEYADQGCGCPACQGGHGQGEQNAQQDDEIHAEEQNDDYHV